MLHLWRDKYCIALSPHRLEVVRRRRGLRPVVDYNFAETFKPSAGESIWKASVAALTRFVASTQTSADVTVVLSNHFVRYLLVPWSDQISSPEEYRNFAAAAFEEIYGTRAAEWEVCVSDERTGSPRLATAVDKDLLSSIRQAAQGTPLRLSSIQPYLMAAFNQTTQLKKSQNFIFMLVETDLVCFLMAENGQWQNVTATTIAGDATPLAVALSATLERQIFLADLQNSSTLPIFVHAAHHRELELPAVLGETPQMLALPIPQGVAAEQFPSIGLAVTAV